MAKKPRKKRSPFDDGPLPEDDDLQALEDHERVRKELAQARKKAQALDYWPSIFELEKQRPDAERGRKFQAGRRKGALSPLGILIEQALDNLPPKASAAQVVEMVKALDGGKVIQEIDDEGNIFWKSKTGERKTSWGRFRNVISEARARREK